MSQSPERRSFRLANHPAPDLGPAAEFLERAAAELAEQGTELSGEQLDE
jgi:hypothetical protein